MITLEPDQQEVFDDFKEFMASEEQYFILKGGSGSGKTTVTGKIVDYIGQVHKSLAELEKNNSPWGSNTATVLCTATTNKAAYVLSQKFEKLSCFGIDLHYGTVHSIFGLTVYTDYSTGKQKLNTRRAKKYDGKVYLFIDEASMADKPLINFLKSHISSNTKVIIIGDPYQLPPVGESSSTAFDLGGHYTRTLQTAKRFASGGGIAQLGEFYKEAVRTGNLPYDVPIDGIEVVHIEDHRFQEIVDQDFRNKVCNAESNKILAYTNELVIAYNNYIRELNNLPAYYEKGETLLLNSAIKTLDGTKMLATEERVTIADIQSTTLAKRSFGSYSFPVIPGSQITTTCGQEIFSPNDMQVFKGALKTLKQAVKNQKISWADYYYYAERGADLRMTYASTIHKSQGSTHDIVYIDMNDMHNIWDRSLFCRLMYVAVTRARKKVYLVGEMNPNYGRITYGP